MRPCRGRRLLSVLFVAALVACGGGRPTQTAGRAAAEPPPSGTAVAPEKGPESRHDAGPGAAAGSGKKMQDGGLVVALVNGEAITARDLELRLGEIHSGSDGAARQRSFDLNRLMFRMVNDLLIAQEARSLGMDREDPVRSKVETYRRKVMVRVLEEERIESRAKPEKSDLLNAFKERCSRVSLRVVTVDKKEDAGSILAEIRAGADMSDVARKRSIDPYAARGGELADVERRFLLPEIGALASSLKPGEIGGPVRTDLGWSILRVDAFKDPDPALFEDLKALLSNLVTLRKSERLRAALADELKKKHPVAIEEAVVRDIRPERRPDGRLVPTTGDRNGVVARIGKKVVLTRGEYGDALLRRWSTVRNEEAARASSPLILSNLLEEKLMLAEALDLGYGDRPDVVPDVRAHENGLLVQRYLDEVVASGIKVSREEIRAYYDAHRAGFRRPPRLHLSQITVATEEEAHDVAGQLRQGTDVAWLARKRSLDRLAGSGGDGGWTIPEPGVDEVANKLMDARAGDVLEPPGVPGNYTVIKVTAREDRGLYDLDEISGNLRQMVTSEKFRKALDEFITKLRVRATIDVKQSVLASLGISGKLESDAGKGNAPPAHAH